jgi:acyl-CoA synthetase (NDP forming)
VSGWVASAFEAARQADRQALDEPAAKRFLGEHGIPVPAGIRVADAAAAQAAARRLKPPFALKAIAPGLIHKSDAGGVRLGLRDPPAIAQALDDMRGQLTSVGIGLEGFLLEEMAPAGHELVVGGLVDPQFGPLVMLGMGGIHVELLDDVVFAFAPIERDGAERLLGSLKASPILAGARGQPPAATGAIVDVILKLAGADGLLARHASEIAEIEINPLIVSAHGAIAVDARIVLKGVGGQAAAEPMALPGQAAALMDYFRPLFEPQTIAVLGASATSRGRVNVYIDQLRRFGFTGDIYPIHPTALAIEGLPAYASLGQTPRPVDYAYVGIPAAGVAPALAAGAGRVAFAHVLASGFAELPEGAGLQAELVAAAGGAGMRLLGPNCVGGHSPRGHLTMIYGGLAEPGHVGVVTQSGGLGIDVIRRGEVRGLRFSGVMTLGNSADLTPADLLAFYLADPATFVIGLYLEGVADGRRLYDLLRQARGSKPVVILKGGRSRQGRQAALSHTGMLAGDDRIWAALALETGAILVDDLEALIDSLLALQMLRPRAGEATRRVALFGNGGGTGVLAVDAFARHGLDVLPFLDATRQALEALQLPPGTSVNNPIDAPIGTLRQQRGKIAEAIMDGVFAHDRQHALVMHLNLPVLLDHVATETDMLENILAAAASVRARHPAGPHFALVLRSDGRPEIEDRKRLARAWALAQGIPVFDELSNAATGLRALSAFEAAC